MLCFLSTILSQKSVSCTTVLQLADGKGGISPAVQFPFPKNWLTGHVTESQVCQVGYKDIILDWRITRSRQGRLVIPSLSGWKSGRDAESGTNLDPSSKSISSCWQFFPEMPSEARLYGFSSARYRAKRARAPCKRLESQPTRAHVDIGPLFEGNKTKDRTEPKTGRRRYSTTRWRVEQLSCIFWPLLYAKSS